LSFPSSPFWISRNRGDTIEHSLAALELHWLEKLQPFGERGYNSAKAYQRDMSRLQNKRRPQGDSL